MEQVFSYIISLGASVMMPILFTIIGLCIGMKFGKSLKSGLYVGVGFVGLGIVTALLTNNFGSPLNEISRLYNLQLGVFDMGWPAAAAVAYNTAVGALIIPICLGVNFLLLITKCTRTVNIDLWNYWHFAFIGAVAYFVMDQSLAWGYFAAIVCYIITLVMADLTAEKFQGYYDDMDGISIPQPFCQSFTAFAIGINWLLDKIPGFSKLDIDAEGLKRKFGVLGEPIVLRRSEADCREDAGGGPEEVGWQEGVYRHVASTGDWSSDDPRGLTDPDSAGPVDGCGPAWQ